MVFTKDGTPVNLLNLQNLLTYEDAYKGKWLFSVFKFETLSPLSFIPPVPYPFGAPSPREEGFWCGAAVFSFRCLPHGGKDLELLPPSSGRRCPKGAEVGSHSRMKSHMRQSVIPFPHLERNP